MGSSTNVNNMTTVHAGSGGTTIAFPDVCKTPAPPAPPIPIPYPNISQSSDTEKGSKKVKVDGNPIMLKGSSFSTSTGDEAGSVGGMVSSKTKGQSEFVNYSFDVKVEGKSVCRLMDPMVCNKGGAANTPPATELQAPLVAIPPAEIKAEKFYVVPIRFRYEKPDVATGKTVIPKFDTAHSIKGPETKRLEFKGYSGSFHSVSSEGEYSLEFDKFDREKRELKPKLEK